MTVRIHVCTFDSSMWPKEFCILHFLSVKRTWRAQLQQTAVSTTSSTGACSVDSEDAKADGQGKQR